MCFSSWLWIQCTPWNFLVENKIIEGDFVRLKYSTWFDFYKLQKHYVWKFLVHVLITWFAISSVMLKLPEKIYKFSSLTYFSWNIKSILMYEHIYNTKSSWANNIVWNHDTMICHTFSSRNGNVA